MESLKVIIRVTDRCNQDCHYCYVDRNNRLRSRARLTTGQITHLYSQILTGKFQHVHIVWHGGEPTLVGFRFLDRVIDLQKDFCQSTVSVENSIQTNTTAVDQNMIEVFKRHNIGVGVSIDAPPDVHKKFRVFWSGRSTFEEVLSKVDLMRKHGLKFGAICVLHKYNYQRTEEIYRFFKQIGLSYQLNPFYQDEATPEDIATDLCLSPEQYGQALISTFDLYVADQNHTIDITEIKDMIGSMFLGASKNCLYSGKCHEFFGVLPTGEIYLCDLFSKEEYRIGQIASVTHHDFETAKPVQKIKQRSLMLQQTVCRGCEWWYICKGGCSSKAAAVCGNALDKDPFCQSRRMLFAHIKAYLCQNLRHEGGEVR